MSRITPSLLVTLFALTLGACQSKREAVPVAEETPPGTTIPAQTTRERPAKPAPAPDQLTDAQIAAIVSTANQAEVAAGKLAVSKTQNPEVTDFAQMMIKDHSSADDQARALLQTLDVAPEETDASRQMKRDADATASRLGALSGDAFDKAYVDAQVTGHQEVLDALDTKLIPGATNAQLKEMLTSVRPVVAMHLEHARALAAKLK